MTRSMSLMMDGWMPSVGSSRMRSLGPDGELLLLAAGKIAPAPAHHLPQYREHLEDALGNPRLAVLGGKPHLEILLHREAREDLPSLRHEADAGARAVLGVGAGQVEVAELHAAGLCGEDAHQCAQQRGLADPVASQQARDLSVGHVEREVAQDVAAAVVLVEVRDGQHA